MIWDLVCTPIDFRWLLKGTHLVRNRNPGIIDAIRILPAFRNYLGYIHQSPIGYFENRTLFYYHMPKTGPYEGPHPMVLFRNDTILQQQVGNVLIAKITGNINISANQIYRTLRRFRRLATVKIRPIGGHWTQVDRDLLDGQSAAINVHITHCSETCNGLEKKLPWTVPDIIIR